MVLRLNNLKSLTIFICLIPLFWLLVDIVSDNLGSNPIQAIHIRLGDWSLRFLCLTLTITPIQIIANLRGMSACRQMLGLYTFFYASLHILTYIIVDQVFVWHVIGFDIIESPYIWFGLLAYIIIFLLAITTPKSAKKRMGKNWKKLHRFIYLAAIAAVVHYFWQLKGNLAEPLFYLIIVTLLLAFRFLVWVKNRKFNKMMIPTRKKVLVLPKKTIGVSETIVEQQGIMLDSWEKDDL